MDDVTKKRYIHKGKEVMCTGKRAQKTLRSGKIDELFEIRPVDVDLKSFVEWVRLSELFEIIE